MSKREVTKTRKDQDGDILALCNTGSNWSPVSKQDAIRHIENGIHEYYVPWKSGKTIIIVVNDKTKGKYLKTVRDGSTRNNLDELPDC